MSKITNYTKFVVQSTGEILTTSQIMASDKSMSIPVGVGPEGMRSGGFIMIRPTDKPAGDVVEEEVPVLAEDGYYDQVWSAREYTEQERLANFETRRQDALNTILAMRADAESKGAPVRIDSKVYHFSLSDSSRIDYQDMARRAQNNINDNRDVEMRTYDNVGTRFILTSESALALADAILEQYAAIWNAAAELRDQVNAATTELPVLPQAIEVDARDIS